MSDQITSREKLLVLLNNDEGLYPAFLEERFPHVLERLASMLGKPQLAGFIDGLLAPPREGVAGFPEQALVEINRIRSFSFTKPLLVEVVHRNSMLAFLDSEHEAYPHHLEAEFPDLFRQISSFLDGSSLEGFLDNLLAADKRFEHRFSEQALMELMTLKSIYRVRRKMEVSQAISAEVHEDHVASIVFDKVQRW